jgi:hypothetical protein
MAVAACAAPVVGKLAESVFGFDVSILSHKNLLSIFVSVLLHDDQEAGRKLRPSCTIQGTATTTGDVSHDLRKAGSLSNALLVMTAVPWTLCCLTFSGLYWTYPRDKGKVLTQQGLSDVAHRGRLVKRNGFLRLEEDGEQDVHHGYDSKWQLLRTQPDVR